MAREGDGTTGIYAQGTVDNYGSDLTIAAWFNVDATTWEPLAGWAEEPGSGTQDKYLAVSGGILKGYVSIGAAHHVLGLTTVTTGVWHHGAFVHSPTDEELRIYLDGLSDATPISQAGDSYTGYSTPEIIVGRTNHGGFGEDAGCDGRIAELAIWKTDLTPNEIVMLASGVSPLKVRPASLFRYFPLFASGDGGQDFTANGSDLTPTGSWAAADGPPVAPMFGGLVPGLARVGGGGGPAGGGGVPPPGAPGVAIDFGNDGVWAAGDDVTSDVRAVPGVKMRRGYNITATPPQPAVGRMTFNLKNDGTYDDDAGSGLGRNDPTRYQHTYDAVTYDLWRGRIRNLAQLPNVDQQMVSIDALDTLSTGPNRTGFSTALFSDITTDVAIGHVLDAMGIASALGSSGGKLDTGTLTCEHFWLSKTDDPYRILTQLVNAEGPKARLYVDGTGIVNFEANDYRTGTTRSTDLQETFRGATTEPIMSRILGKRDGIDRIVNKASISRKSLGASVSIPEVVLFEQVGSASAQVSVTWAMPGSLQPTDLIFAFVAIAQSGAAETLSATPTGWTDHPDGAVDPGGGANYTFLSTTARVADLTPGDQTWTASAATGGMALQVTVVRNGQDWGNPYVAEGSSTTENATPANMNADDVTVDGAGEMVLIQVLTDASGSNAITPEAGYTELGEVSGFGGLGGVEMATASKRTTDDTDEDPDFAFTGGNSRSRMYGYSIKPLGDVIWSSDVAITVPSGGTSVFEIETTLPFEAAQVPAAATGDFVVSGGALDSVTLSRVSGTSTLLTFTATGGGDVTIDAGARCRALLHTNGPQSSPSSEDSTSITAFEERGLKGYSTWAYISEADAQTLADAIVADFKDQRQLVVFRVHGDRADAAMIATLEREISDRVRLLTTRGGIDVTGWVERIDHHVSVMGYVTTDLAIWEVV